MNAMSMAVNPVFRRRLTPRRSGVVCSTRWSEAAVVAVSTRRALLGGALSASLSSVTDDQARVAQWQRASSCTRSPSLNEVWTVAAFLAGWWRVARKASSLAFERDLV